MTALRPDDRHPTGAVPLRVLVALHGYEPTTWTAETCRVVSTWAGASVRVLAVLDVPSPPFTSLTGYARQAYYGARAQWAVLEEQRLAPRLEELLRALPPGADTVRARAMRGDLARTIAEHADAWPADVVVVGAPVPGLRSWLRPGAVHQRLVRLAACTVLVTTPPPASTPPARRFAFRRDAAVAAQRA